MKVAHLADLHLGFRQFDRLTPRGTNQREADVADAFRRAVDDLLEQQPDLILIAGDVFHSVRPTNAAILFFFQQLQRVHAALPDTPIVMIAGNHDTPRSTETGTILRLYEALGVEVVVDTARRLTFPKLDCAVLAVPHQALALLLLHGEVEGVIGTDPTIAEYGGAVLTRADLGAAQWDYVALGHYHVAHEVAANAWYPGALEYVSTNPWGELRDEAKAKRPGKGYLLVDLPGARVSFRPVAPARRFIDLLPLDAAGLGPKEIDARIAERVSGAKPPIDDQVVRLVVTDVARATARDLDHATIRGYKARALNFLLDLRRPVERRTVAVGGPGKRHTLPEVVRGFLERRLLDAELPREEFVRLGVEYVERAGAPEDQG